MTRIGLLALASVALGLASSLAQEPLDPYEWTIETYSFPAYDLASGFTSPDRGALIAPPLPDDGASDQEIHNFIGKSSSIATHYLETLGLALPKGTLVIFDPESMTLAARLPRIAQSSVAFTAEAFREDASKYIAFDHVILEAPDSEIRTVISAAGKKANLRQEFEALMDGTAEGDVNVLTSTRIEARSGHRTKVERIEDVAMPLDLLVDTQDQIEFDTTVTPTGSMLEIDPVIGADGQTIDVSLSLDYHYAPAQRRQERLTLRGENEVSAAVVDTHNAIVQCSTTMRSGTSKLIGVWKPEGVDGAAPREVLQASFLSADIVAVLPLPNDRVTQLLREHGEAVEPVPEGVLEFEGAANEIPEGMIVRRFRVPPSILTRGAAGFGGGRNDDPFADLGGMEPRFTIRATAKDILQAAGISFPKGSSANYLSATSDLIIRNTPENIAIVEAFVMAQLEEVQKTVGTSVHIIQAPGAVIRRLAAETRAQANHEPAWRSLNQAEGIKIVGSYWLEGTSGQRSKIEAGRNHMHHIAAIVHPGVTSSSTTPKQDEKEADKASPTTQSRSSINLATGGSVSSSQEIQRVGTTIEMDPVIGADGKTIDLNIQVLHDYAPPVLVGQANRQDDGTLQLDGPTTSFHEASTVTGMTLRSGMVRMIATWRPVGTPEFENNDILQAVFVRAELIPVE